MTQSSPLHVLNALRTLDSDLPVLVGVDWQTIEPQYRAFRTQLESATGPAQMLAAAEILQLLAPYASARERLSIAITEQTEAGAALLSLAAFADQLGLDPTVSAQFREAARPENEQRFIFQNSPTKAVSLKLENVTLNFEFGAFAEFFAGLITTATKDVLGEANLILQAMGALLMIASLYKATAIKLEEREATVFCGFAKAPRKPNGGVKEEVILAHTNAVRASVNLKPLDRQELNETLFKLAELKSVDRVQRQVEEWKIVEEHNVKQLRK